MDGNNGMVLYLFANIFICIDVLKMLELSLVFSISCVDLKVYCRSGMFEKSLN